jgi:aspartate aminotransferase-like enzyme
LACPGCSTKIVVPPPPTEENSPSKSKAVPPATEKQKQFATELGVEFPDSIDRRAISELIDAALQKQDEERFDRLNALQNNENNVREEIRAEIMAECDEDDPRVSTVTTEQLMEAYAMRDKGAILISFEYGVLSGIEDSKGEKFDINSTDDLEPDDIKRIITMLGMALMRQ